MSLPTIQKRLRLLSLPLGNCAIFWNNSIVSSSRRSLVRGYGLLSLQAHLRSLRPPECETAGKWNDCQKLHGFNAAVLYIGLYTVAIVEGCLRACLPSFGGNQFDRDDPVEAHLQLSFFNWFTTGLSFGVFIGLILLVWIDDNTGWEYGFGISALLILVGILVFMSGLPFYRNKKPRGSLMTRVMQISMFL